MKNGRFAGQLINFGTASLALVLGVVRLSAQGPAPSLPADLRLVPRTALGFVTLRVADLWNDERTRELRQQFLKIDPRVLPQFRELAGLDLSEVERLTLVVLRLPGADQPEPSLALLIGTARPIGQTKAFDDLLARARAEKRAGKTFYLLNQEALYLHDDRALVLGLQSAVEAILDQLEAKKEGSLTRALSLAAKKQHFTLALNLEAMPRGLAQQIPLEAQVILPFLRSRLLTATGHCLKDTRLQVELQCANYADARKVVDSTRQLFPLIPVGLGLVSGGLDREGIKAPHLRKILKEINLGLRGLRLELDRTTVRLRMTLRVDLRTMSSAALEILKMIDKRIPG